MNHYDQAKANSRQMAERQSERNRRRWWRRCAMTASFAGCFVIAVLLMSILAADARAQDRVKMGNGVVEGTTETGSPVRTFKGIPFAAPPVGDLRWQAPQPVKDW